MQTKMFVAAFVFFASVCTSSSQAFRVDLPQKIVLPDVHTTFFHSSPSEKLLLPNIDTTGAMFFDLFYCRTADDDVEISFMVFNRDSGDVIYADLNNNEDLTDDGPPIFFSHQQPTQSFDIRTKNDSMQITTLRVRRKPAVPDSMMKDFVTSTGDADPKIVRIFNLMSSKGTGLGGSRGTFYFDERVTVRRGIVLFDEAGVRIGLFDWSNNGLYNDDEDVLLIDLNGDGVFDEPSGAEAFKLNDVFSLHGKRFEIASADKYGRWVDIQQTEKLETFYMLKEKEQQGATNKSVPSRGQTKTLKDKYIWNLNLKTIGGKPIDFSKLLGRFVLLNFWGEWCGPCVMEIPELVESYRAFTRAKLEFIGFLKTSNLAKARQLIKEKEVEWQQILLPEKLESEMDIHAYPTNILLLPDGKSYIRVTGAANKAFFVKHVQ